MKKRSVCILFIAFSLISMFSFSLFSTFLASAQTSEEIISEQFGIKQEQIEKIQEIPKSPEEIQETYLKQEWQKIISKIPVIGKIHDFALNNPLPFKIVFAEPYSFSLTFFLIVILWIIIAINLTKIIKSFGIIKENLCWIAGILLSIIVAQTKIYSIIVKSSLSLIFSQETIWARMIIFIILVSVIIIIHFSGKMLSSYIKQQREKKKEEKIEKEVEKKLPKTEQKLSGLEKLAEELAHLEALREEEYRKHKGLS